MQITEKQYYTPEEYLEDENISLETVPFEICLKDLYNKVKFEVVESEPENNQ
ncbi:hypothetical protein [Trichormus sp. NMC-1]|uniref:hypothetical protein n=1 Tax=Trichormus sp. NMC-1 TaxID=1853259 RepID=UPI0015A52380|nr:hypothetical protein [Trichormus sp. NMC-1]